MEIVNGYTGTDNVTAEMDGGLYASLAGSGKYVLELGSKLACSVTSANQITIADGGVLINGRYGYIRQGATDTLTIDNGRTGYNRNDLVVAHYHAKAQSGIESLNLEIVKGKESTGLAADPVLAEGNILTGDKDAYLPLYRLPITGINLGTPVKLFKTLKPFGESLKQMDDRIAWVTSRPHLEAMGSTKGERITWTWVKFSNGFAEVWGYKNMPDCYIDGGPSNNYWWYSGDAHLDWPFKFVESPTAQVQFSSPVGIYGIWLKAVDPSGITFAAWSNGVKRGFQAYAHIHALGRWK